MPTFVDYVGLNTLVSSSFDDTNTITSNVNNAIASIPPEEKLVGINLHRNGPYGYSSWKQLRVSENPVTRKHRTTNTMTFIVQPGPMRNVLANGVLRVRDRYSAIYNYTEPAITQKAYPLVWNVGRHFKDEDGNVDFENPQRFSIISSYGNQQIAFANDRVSKLLKFDPDEEQTEYVAIKDMYLENGLNKQDSPLTHWEFLQYRETIFPKAPQQFVSQTRTRPQFVSFYRHARLDRRTHLPVATAPFGFPPILDTFFASSWPMDAGEEFLTRIKVVDSNINLGGTDGTIERKPGQLQPMTTTFLELLDTYSADLTSSIPADVQVAMNFIDLGLAPYPIYNKRISLNSSQSVSNPSGMEIYGTASTLIRFEGNALWEAGDKRQIKNDDGTYTSAPKQPFYDTYENYAEDVRKFGKNYSIIPEFRMSAQVEDYLKTDGEIEADMFEVTGGVSDAENSSKSDFYEIYSNTDFMKNFEVIADDHKDFTNGKVLSLRCKAIKKFLPYEGFYPCQRTVDLSKRFYDSYKKHIKLYNVNNVELDDFNYGRQMMMAPLFAPGILFNTIKSGVAVDYPIITGSLIVHDAPEGNFFINSLKNFDKRIPFEALISPANYLAEYKLTSNEPHPSGNLSASAAWDGTGDGFYSMMANNFLAESINFFLPNGQLSSVVSKRQEDIRLVPGSVYGMRVKMRRSMSGSRGSVYHIDAPEAPYFPPQDVSSGSVNNRETFTMYSRPSAFGPPTRGVNTKTAASSDLNAATATMHSFGISGRNELAVATTGSIVTVQYEQSSKFGYNFPYTPPYYHGEAWCHITFTASSDSMTIKEIQSSSSYEYTRFDNSFFSLSSNTGVIFSVENGLLTNDRGAQSIGKVNDNAVQLSASLNIQGIGTIKKKDGSASAGSLIVDTAVGENSRWVIQTKFETPMLNFNHISGSDHLALPLYGSGSVPRGMWHQYGRKPEEKEGVFLQVGPIPDNYQRQVMNKAAPALDMSEALGFSGIGTKLGRIANKKQISEAVVAIPFIKERGKRKFFKIDKKKVDVYKRGPVGGAHMLAEYAALTDGEPSSQIGRSVLDQMEKMKKYIFPPSFDFMNFDTDKVAPIAMYIFEFSHTLTQTDLQDIWQNLPPTIGTEMEVAEVAITHPLIKKELLGQGGEGGNDTIEMSDNLKWMVFKVKQRAASNYFKKTVLRNPEVNTEVESGNVTQDEFGQTSTFQYNWPYDFFSLVEMVRIDSEVEMGNIDLSNYTDVLPGWDAVQADEEKIADMLGGLEDDVLPEVDVPEGPNELLDSATMQLAPAGLNVNLFAAPKEEATDVNLGSAQPSGGVNFATLGIYQSEYRLRLVDRNSEFDITADSHGSAKMAAIVAAAGDVSNSFELNIAFLDIHGYSSSDPTKMAFYDFINEQARLAY